MRATTELANASSCLTPSRDLVALRTNNLTMIAAVQKVARYLISHILVVRWLTEVSTWLLDAKCGRRGVWQSDKISQPHLVVNMALVRVSSNISSQRFMSFLVILILWIQCFARFLSGPILLNSVIFCCVRQLLRTALSQTRRLTFHTYTVYPKINIGHRPMDVAVKVHTVHSSSERVLPVPAWS